MPFLPDVTVIQLVLIVGLAAFSAIAGGSWAMAPGR
jgi:hypothetical protein